MSQQLSREEVQRLRLAALTAYTAALNRLEEAKAAVMRADIELDAAMARCEALNATSLHSMQYFHDKWYRCEGTVEGSDHGRVPCTGFLSVSDYNPSEAERELMDRPRCAECRKRELAEIGAAFAKGLGQTFDTTGALHAVALDALDVGREVPF